MPTTLISSDRRRINDGTACMEMRQGGLRHVEEEKKFGSNGSLQLLGRNPLNTLLWVLLRRIIHENVKTVQFRDRLVDAVLATADDTHIPGYDETPSTFFFYKPLGFSCILMLVEIDDRHIGALLGEGYGDGSPYSTIATGNQGHLSMKFAATSSRAIFRLGLRNHL